METARVLDHAGERDPLLTRRVRVRRGRQSPFRGPSRTGPSSLRHHHVGVIAGHPAIGLTNHVATGCAGPRPVVLMDRSATYEAKDSSPSTTSYDGTSRHGNGRAGGGPEHELAGRPVHRPQFPVIVPAERVGREVLRDRSSGAVARGCFREQSPVCSLREYSADDCRQPTGRQEHDQHPGGDLRPPSQQPHAGSRHGEHQEQDGEYEQRLHEPITALAVGGLLPGSPLRNRPTGRGTEGRASLHTRGCMTATTGNALACGLRSERAHLSAR